MKFTILEDPSLVIITIYNAFSLYDFYGHALAQKTPAPVTLRVTILVDPSLS